MTRKQNIIELLNIVIPQAEYETQQHETILIFYLTLGKKFP